MYFILNLDVAPIAAGIQSKGARLSTPIAAFQCVPDQEETSDSGAAARRVAGLGAGNRGRGGRKSKIQTLCDISLYACTVVEEEEITALFGFRFASNVYFIRRRSKENNRQRISYCFNRSECGLLLNVFTTACEVFVTPLYAGFLGSHHSLCLLCFICEGTNHSPIVRNMLCG